ncbi:uridine kinase [Acrocarpospora phusangensis]|uniref:Uridine kinase n=1 Tax=Acrocarpospora phusangensis TaxID=1070424 RepID=A0A919QGS7_9ACTN|nr:uridine kinase [Acrocarpospora phusangensis]GIH28523.1 uridine kinase [Acrocarpospora phusangensis]
MRARPISQERLVEELADRIAAYPRHDWVRVAVDGAPAANPGELADALVGPLRVRGRETLRVSSWDFLRPASLRFEYGKQDPDAYYDDWLDVNGLIREVLAPLDPGGTGKVLPTLWDPVRDRATRAPYTVLPAGTVLLLDGSLLLGRWLPLEFTVHLRLSPAALARRTADAWTAPAFLRYEAEVEPASTADVAVSVDRPGHPALIEEV